MIKIFNQYYPIRNVLFVVGEGGLIFLSVILAAIVRLGGLDDGWLGDNLIWSKIFLITLVCQVSLYYFDLYDLKVTDTFLELGIRLLHALGVASIGLAVIYYIFPQFIMGRGIFFITLAFLVLLVTSWRFIYNLILRKNMFAQRLLLVGNGRLAADILAELEDKLDSGYKIVGLVPMARGERTSQTEIPIFENIQDLKRLVEEEKVDKIVVSMDERRGALPVAELLDCRMNGTPVIEGETFYEILTGKILVEKINPSWLIFSEGFKKTPLHRVTKRLVGFALASIGLLITAPVILITAIAIKLDSRGPVFFKQERIGENGRIFKVYKFRSMRTDAELNSGPVWAQEDDPRITRVGRIIRNLRIDEIPQMWNVLKGNMSFVGPRPERPHFVNELRKIVPYYDQRHTVRPGITGWAQVLYPYGASEEDALQKLKYDLYYVKHMSVVMDLLIVVKTIKIVLFGRGSR